MRHSSVFLPIITLCISAAPLYVILYVASWPVYILEIAHAEGGGRVFWVPINPGDHFSLIYTHSVQLSRVADDFEIDQHHGMVLVATTFSDHGAGLPYSLRCGGAFSVQDRFKISDMRMFLPEILLRVEKKYDNIFVFGDRRINLSKMYGDSLLTIRTKKRTVFEWLVISDK